MRNNLKVVSFKRTPAYVHHRAMLNRRDNNIVDALELMRRCSRIIDAGVVLGETNARMAELIAAARAMPGYESRA